MQDSNTSSLDRRLISSGSEYEHTYSYSRAIAIGNRVLLSGTTGYHYATGQLPASAREQTLQLFHNVESALEKAGGSLADIVRVRIYISDDEKYEDVMQVFAEKFRGINPTCTTVAAGLFNPALFVEMDMDAILTAGT